MTRALTRAGPTTIAVITLAATFMAFLDVTIVNVAFPDMRSSFAAIDPRYLSWVLTAYNIAFAALLLSAGRVADMVGNRRVFLAGLGVFVAASALCAAAPSVPTLVSARVLQAAGSAAIMPTALALLILAFPSAHQTTTVALAAAVAGIAAALGPSLGGLLVDLAGWRAVFLVNVPIGLAALIAGARCLPATATARRDGVPDPWGTALLILAMGAITLGIVQAPVWGWVDARTSAALLAGTAGIAAFVRRGANQPVPAFDMTLLRSRGISVANAASLIFAAGFFAKILCDVLFLTSVWGYSTLEAGLALTPSPVITAVAAVGAGRAAERFGTIPVVLIGAGMYAVACIYYAVALPVTPAYVERFLPATTLTGVGIACALPLLTVLATTTVGSTRLASASAANTAARQLGGVLGVAVLVAMLAEEPQALTSAPLRAGWVFIAGCAAVTGLVVATQRRALRDLLSP